MTFIKKYISLFLGAAALLAAGCTDFDDATPEPPAATETDDGTEEVTFTLYCEPDNDPFSRAAGLGSNQSIGRGRFIDLLIYAVYLEAPDNENPPHPQTHLTQYGQGMTISNDVNEGDTINETGTGVKFADGREIILIDKINNPHEGQTIVYLGDALRDDDGSYTMKLRLMRNETYRIAFWAQSIDTDAFDTNDLRNVTVAYPDTATNNNELRDAFCAVEIFSVSQQTTGREVVLSRPFAQINVATTGADYVSKGTAFTHSEVTLSGVSNTLNVVEETVGDAIDDPVTFRMSPFIGGKYPGLLDASVSEEYLYVNMDDHTQGTHGNNMYLPYKVTYPTLEAGTDGSFTALTETFKYLSMCYVLVPSEKLILDTETGNDYEGSQIINYETAKIDVTVTFADATGNNTATRRFDDVVCRRNWRSNILGGLNTKDDDTKSIFVSDGGDVITD